MTMKRPTAALLCAVVLFLATGAAAVDSSVVEVVAPATLAGTIGVIPNRPALFGKPAFDGGFTAPLYVASTIAEGENHACSALHPIEGVGEKIVLIQRGAGSGISECTFVRKVRNAQDAGASAVIVYNNVTGPRLPYMADDGSGSSIHIPAVFISNENGVKLMNGLGPGFTNNVLVKMEWGLPPQSHVAQFKIFTSALDEEAQNFKDTFEILFQELGDRVTFVPEYFVRGRAESRCNLPGAECTNLCTNNNRYCASDSSYANGRVTGTGVMRENLRQACLYDWIMDANGGNNDTDIWWQYVHDFDKECAGITSGMREISAPNFSEQCSLDIMDKLRVDLTAVRTCMGTTTDDNVNTMLERMRIDRLLIGAYVLPTVFVNDHPYRGSVGCPAPLDFTSCPLMQFLCASFPLDDQPAACMPGCPVGQSVDKCGVCDGSNECENGLSVQTVVTVLVLGLIAVVIIGYLYIRHRSRQMRVDLDNIIAQYMPMQDPDGAQAGRGALLEKRGGGGGGGGGGGSGGSRRKRGHELVEDEELDLDEELGLDSRESGETLL